MRHHPARSSSLVLTALLLFGTGCPPVQAARSPARPGAGPGSGAGAPRVAQGPGQITPTAPPATPPARPVAESVREAEAAERAGDAATALGQWQDAWDNALSAAFRLWVERRVRALVAPLGEARLLVEAARLTAGSRVRALVEARRVEVLVAAGREDRAWAILKTLTAGLEPAERQVLEVRAGRPDTFGALVPLTGPLAALGREILQGMALAAGLVGRTVGATATVVARDSERDAPGGARDLARAGVLAILGVPRSTRARQVAPVCQAAGVTLLTGADGHNVPALGSVVFRAVHAPSVRAKALAAWLAGARLGARVAVVHPDNAYGRRTAGAFAAEATRLGLTVVGTVSYPRKEANLYPRFRPLAAKALDAVFVADSAVHLELVAPQLALAGLGPVPAAAAAPRRRRRSRPRAVRLLSTAEGLRGRLVKNVAHAVEGAVLAPGFFPDPKDPQLASFVSAYQQAYGRLPGRYAAVGYLWLLELRSLLLSKARGRVSLGVALARRTKAGRPIFDTQGERVDPPRLYQVRQGVITRLLAATATGGTKP